VTDTLGVNELAGLFGVTRRTISDLVRRGVIARRGRGFDQDESTRRYVAHLREIKAGRGQAAGGVAQVSARARLAAAQAEAQELKNSITKGALIAEGIVESEWSGIIIAIRHELLAVSAQFAAAAPHADRKDVATVDRLVREAMTRLGEGASK
jgi:phage terminase Nu1 subunit (DNA packaging protein)